ncbi:uncharacterized protein IUM83_07430 [Phytophthora cinnamomi]|uniref:uncharacterized protein n=1 Tax=Phytophthora cinnamomi TaxID=4785 RepID=UPI00355A232A|nr:hypothetical protein IUM83_07430 [Phytophthora cinnamomi]
MLMRYLDRLDLEEVKREKDKARHAYSQTIAAQSYPSAEDGTNAREEDADAYAEQDDHSVANNPNAAEQLDAIALQSTDASAKPNDRIVPNSPDTSGQLIPTSPHVMDEDAPTSSPSSSGSHDPNIVRPGEKPEDFVKLDSDDENDVNSVHDDDDDLGPTEPAAEDAGTAPDLHFQPSLLGAVGGVAEITRGNVCKNVLSDIKFNGWREPSNVTPHPYMHEPARGTSSC